ncbi:MAG TPA: PQQ-dependent dehydrogenase, methanol/ethanol family, partial [Pyrinomonadaceae bacterium]|nr:PQQ-dependent dehydrogenase, methanol/ethanol family [Pyrinomonadaceae bacterium]
MKHNLSVGFRGAAIVACGFLLVAACNKQNSPLKQSAPNQVLTAPTGATIAVEPEDGQWTMPAKNYASTRFSSLQDINTGNAAALKLAWSFSTGVVRGHEAAPIIANNMMYIITPYPNIVYAIDLTQPGGPVKWKYEANPASSSQGVACCDVVNRGGVYSDGKIFFNTLDNNTIALDAATGKEIWKTKVGDINLGESITMAPLVVKGKVLVGNSGGEFGVRGWLTALNAVDGKIAWRAYHTGPDADVLIGPNFKPFYPQDRGKDLGVTSWPADAWKIGGGTMWGWISYDPEQNLIFYGTANPGPWNPDQRPGDNKWTCGIFARDVDTGEARWFYQFTPHDLHDYDSINEQILMDMPVNGQTRKVLVRPERNGYFYVMDRTNGQVLSANPFGYITSSKGVDLGTGKLIENEEKKPEVGKVVREICPAAPGAKDWQPSAFSPRTGLVYIPHQNLCEDAEGLEANYIAGTPYVGMNVRMYAGPGGNRGEFLAWDPVKNQKVWAVSENFPVWSGALVTAGDVVFYGTMDGWFKALDAK